MGGVCVIEWAGNVDKLIPDDILDIRINIKDNNEREVILKSETKEYIDIIKNI